MMMYLRLLHFHVSVILVILTGIPQISSYAKVSRTGTKITPIISSEIVNRSLPSQGRNFQASPVYIPSKKMKLHNGEAIDFSPIQHYSTLDEEMVAKLDGKKSTKEAQDRFHPPAPFEHTIAHSNKLKNQGSTDSGSSENYKISDSPNPSMSVSSGNYATLPKDVYSDSYDYRPEGKPLKDSFPSITIDSYPPDNYNSKPPDSYSPSEMSYSNSPVPSYLDKYPESFDHPIFDDSPYQHNHDHYEHELIYDHPPDDYHHDYTTMKPTEEPEMNDQRLNKRPYSYYYIGKKLWYLPLYFSIYFIIYIAALVLKSIARHKINFPANLAEAAGARSMNNYNNPGWWDLTKRILDGIDKFASENSPKNNPH